MSSGTNTTLLLVRQELKRREGSLIRALFAVVLLVGSAVFFVWGHEQVNRMSLELNKLKNARVEAERENDLLRLESNTLRNLPRIEEYAVTRLGMIYPDPSNIRVIREP